ncbi:hypothetical protein QN277_018347 [Acacia crassicarpa]|uniref:Chaperonin-like RbcX protein n=1 Tax=Acacia crassicarpa TaxID=499986 RepID=A0AAE1MSK6_9FABA|nr:hypothetical protein QN277_018347 [Acacia crassicarpa]
MMGALSVVGGSSVMDSQTSPCLCVDALPTTSMNLKSDFILWRNIQVGKKKQIVKSVTMDLRSSIIGSGRGWRLSVTRSSKKQRKDRKLAIVNELGGQYEDTFGDVKAQILKYFTYKAVRTVLQQLYEMNPPKYKWFYNFIVSNKPEDGKLFLRTLAKEHQELAERVMVTRLHLYGKWVKKCNHAEIYQEISDENLELMRERLMETVIWPSDDSNTEKIG